MNFENVIEKWDEIKAPEAPELNQITIIAKETAFLILDLQLNNCNEDRRPRCVQQLNKIAEFLAKVRDKKMLVVYALTRSATVENIRLEVFPLESEAIVQSGVDKFYNTKLEKILRENKITSVIIVGTSAHGAVLHTATGAAKRGFKIVIPVDGLSASNIYAEQYTTWHLVNGPGTRRNVTLTTLDLIKFD